MGKSILRYKWLKTIALLLSVNYCFAQDQPAEVLNFDSYMDIVRTHHPMAQRASLRTDQGAANLLKSRGGFDPKVGADLNQKYFDGTQYYSNINGGLKVPTWFGLTFGGGIDQNRGTYLNPENLTPDGGLLYAGVSLSVGQGMFIDERRAALKKAKLFLKISEAERQILLNELIYSAGAAYWKWFQSYNTLLIYEDALALAMVRYQAVKQGAWLGDRPSIDTVEAGIQVQNRQLGLIQSQLEYKNTSALLSTFLWADGIVPLELKDGTAPAQFNQVFGTAPDLTDLSRKDSLLQAHPKITRFRNNISRMQIDRRLKMEQLKPVVDLKYNAITEPLGNQTFSNYSIENYTWGLKFQMPLFLRKERGNLKLTTLKIQESELLIANTQEMLQYEITASFNRWSLTKQQVDLYQQTVKDYNRLLQGEQQLFDTGESSLFLVNSRELGYINARTKLIELLTKNRLAELSTNYALGRLFN